MAKILGEEHDAFLGYLMRDKPEVLLLLEGINNLGASTATQVDGIANHDHRGPGPQRRCDHRDGHAGAADVEAISTGTTLPKIQALNTQIFALAAQYQSGASRRFVRVVRRESATHRR